MTTIFVDSRMDPADRVMSACAALQFAPAAHDAKVREVVGRFDRAEVGPHDLALGLAAGDRGVSGEPLPDGGAGSCLAAVVARFAPEHVRALDGLVKEVERGHLRSYAAAMLAGCRYDLGQAVMHSLPYFKGRLELGSRALRAVLAAERAERVGDRRIAILTEYCEGIHDALRARGVWAFVEAIGDDRGIVSTDPARFAPNPSQVVALVQKRGQIDDWRLQGHRYCRGGGSVAPNPAWGGPIEPGELAQAVTEALDEIGGGGPAGD